MQKEKNGVMGKVVDILFFKVPWYIFLAILICVPLLGAVIDALLPNGMSGYIGNIIAIPAAIILLYIMIGLILGAASKILHAKDSVDLLYKLFYKPKYKVLLIVAIILAIVSGVIWENALNLNTGSPDLIAQLAENYCDLFVLFLSVAMLFAFFGILIKFILHLTRWCPSCGRFFALQRASREVIESQQISIKQTLDTKNSHGEVIGTTETYVPGTRQTVKLIEVCKYCGSELQNYKTHESANL